MIEAAALGRRCGIGVAGFRLIEFCGALLDALAEGQVRGEGAGDVAEGDAAVADPCEFGHEVSAFGAEGAGTDEGIGGGIAVELEETAVFMGGAEAGPALDGEDGFFDSEAVGAGGVGVGADAGHLGIGEDDPGNFIGVECSGGFACEVGDDLFGFVGGGVDEQVSAEDIASGIDAGDCGLAAGTDLEKALAMGGEAYGFQVEVTGVARAAHGGKDIGGFDRFFGALVQKAGAHDVVLPANLLHLCTAENGHAFGAKKVGEGYAQFGGLIGEDMVAALEEGDVDTEAAHHLRHFQGDVAATEDEHGFWQGFEGKEGFVGEGGCSIEPGDGWVGGAGAGGDEDGIAVDGFTVDGNGALAVQASVTLDEAEAFGLREGVLIIAFAELGNQLALIGKERADIDVDAIGGNAREAVSLAGMCLFGGADEVFGGDAAHIQTAAAQGEPLMGEGDLHAALDGIAGGRDGGGAAPKDKQVG